MTAVDHSSKLTGLAQSRSTADRERLLMAVVDLCEGVQATSPKEMAAAEAMLSELFVSLVVQAARDVRRRLAERIAEAHWAPLALINVLALDEIEIARPIIATSPLLQDEDLIRLLREATVEHHVEVARRPGIGGRVVEAILNGHDPMVMTALASNEYADLQGPALARLIEEARKTPSLRSPLARHPQLTPDLAEKLYAWVGESLRTAIVSRFKIDAAALDRALSETVRDLSAAAAPSAARSAERLAMEARLVDKLHQAGQLRSGYLLRALREQKLSLFEAALAKLGGLDIAQVRRALIGDRPERLALACLAAGIDRSVFPTVLGLVRGLNSGQPDGGSEGMQRATDMYNAYTADNAALVLSEALGSA